MPRPRSHVTLTPIQPILGPKHYLHEALLKISIRNSLPLRTNTNFRRNIFDVRCDLRTDIGDRVSRIGSLIVIRGRRSKIADGSYSRVEGRSHQTWALPFQVFPLESSPRSPSPAMSGQTSSSSSSSTTTTTTTTTTIVTIVTIITIITRLTVITIGCIVSIIVLLTNEETNNRATRTIKKQTNEETSKETNKTNKQTYQPIHLFVRQTDRQTHRQADNQTDKDKHTTHDSKVHACMRTVNSA